MKRIPTLSIASASVLALILTLGIGLRLSGLPQARNVDELNVILRAVMIADGQQHIHWYNWPAQSLMRVDGAIFAMTTALHARNAHVPYDAAYYYQKYEATFRTLGHLTTVGFAAASILLTYFIGRQMGSRATGLLASLFLAVSYQHVKHSRFATPDVPMTAALLGALFCAFAILDRTRKSPQERTIWQTYFFGGGIVGFAIATKYTGVIALLPLGIGMMIHGMRIVQTAGSWKQAARFIFRFGFFPLVIGVLLMHTIFNPFAFFDLREIQRALLFESRQIRLDTGWGGQDLVFLRNLWYYIKGLFIWSGTGIAATAFLGMIISVIWFRKPAWQKTSFATGIFVLILLGISFHNLHWSRWAIPFTPFIALLAADALIRLFHQMKTMPRHFTIRLILARFAFLFLITAMIFPQIIIDVAEARKYHKPSLPAEVSRYIQANISPGSVIIADTYYVRSKAHDLRDLRIGMFQETVATHKQKGVQYILAKPRRLEQARQQSERYGNIITFFEDLERNAIIVKKFSLRCDSILQHKRDLKVYQWIWQNGIGEFGGSCKGQALWLYQL